MEHNFQTPALVHPERQVTAVLRAARTYVHADAVSHACGQVLLKAHHCPLIGEEFDPEAMRLS